MSSRVTGGALRSAYTAGGRASGSTFVGGWGRTGGLREGINLSPMQADPRAYSLYLQDVFSEKIRKEEEEMSRKLSDLEQRIRRYEERVARGERLSETDNMQYQRLISDYNKVLNPGRGYMGFKDTPQAVPSSKRIGDPGRALKREEELLKQLGKEPKTINPPSGRTKSITEELGRIGTGFERIEAAQILSDPQKYKDYQLAKSRYELDLAKETRLADKEKAKKQILEDVNKAIKSGNLDADTISQLNNLNSRRFEPGADVDGIVAEMGALAESARAKEARAIDRDIDRETRAKTEWDRKRDIINNDRISAENRAVSRRRVDDRTKSQAVIQNELNEVSDDIYSANAEIAELERLAAELSPSVDDPSLTPEEKKIVEGIRAANAPRVQEINSAIQARRVQLSGLQAELQSKQSRAPQSPAGGMGRPTGYSSADDVRAAYESGALSEGDAVRILREQFGYQ